VSRILGPPPPPLPMSSIPLLLPSTPCWVSMGSRPNKQTNSTTWKKNITQTRLVWGGGEMGRDLVCFLGQFHFTVMAEKASQDTATHTSVWLPGGWRGGIKVVLGTDTSSSDPIHSCCGRGPVAFTYKLACTLQLWGTADGPQSTRYCLSVTTSTYRDWFDDIKLSSHIYIYIYIYIYIQYIYTAFYCITSSVIAA